jgi:hypothetical protein
MLLWTVKLKSSRVLTAGKRAVFTRALPPWLSRALTSSARTAARYASSSQPSSLAGGRAARKGPRIPGALSTRDRYASSDPAGPVNAGTSKSAS